MTTARTRIAVSCTLASLALFSCEVPAAAQSKTGFAVNRYEPAERGSAWLVVEDLDLRGHGREAFGATLDYAHKPLVAYDSAQNERLALVRHQLFMHAGGSLVVFERLRLGVSVPVAVYQDGEPVFVAGEELKAATAPAFGDVRLAADVRIAGRYGDAVRVAAGVRGFIPTGARSQFTSDGYVRIAPHLLVAGDLGPLAWAARAAIVYRGRDDAYAGTSLGSEMAFAFGAGVRLGSFLVGPELFMAMGLAGDSFFRPHGTPADAVVGVHYAHASGLRVGAGLGSGLSRGYGSPALRALLSIEWGLPVPTAPADRDGDRVPDAVDACPDSPGVASGDPELHGCPPPERVPDEDTDGDAIVDRDDACPTVTGIRTSDPMTNGCPEGTPRQLAIVTKTEIRIGEQVQFATDSADLVSESDNVLLAVKKTLEDHPEITKVRIEGHTDATGDAASNDDLSRRRAASVAKWMIDHGIDRKRLESTGLGSRKPIDTNETEEGRAKNRRVVFTIATRESP